jgi:cytochrome c biogenesis protein
MSQAIDTPPRPAPRERSAGHSGSTGRSRALPPHVWLFRRLTSMRFALVLLFVLALLTLAGTLLAQAPAQVKGNPGAYAEWLGEVRSRYGGWTGVLDKLGFFSVFSSIWFRGTLLLLSASVLSCSARRAPRLWKTATRPRMVMTKAFFERAPHRATIASEADPGTTLTSLRAAFRSHHFRTAVKRDGDDVHVCADRFRWAPFGRIVAHVSFVVIIAGAVLTATGGFRDEAFAVPVGGKKNVGHGTGMTVEAKSFADSYYTSGEPSDYASKVVLYKGGTPVRTQEIRVNHPMRYGGVTFYQSFFGPTVVMEAKTPDGKVVFNRGVPLLFSSRDEKHSVGRFQLPRQDLTVFVVSPQSGEVDPRIGAGQAQLEIYRSSTDTPAGIKVLTQGRPATVAGVDFTFVREREFTGLIVAHDPGSTLVWIGATLLVLGMFVVFSFPHRRVRAVIRPGAGGSEVAVAAIKRRDAAFADHFERLVDDIRRAVGADAQSPRGGTAHA